jgi:hypothetical protein
MNLPKDLKGDGRRKIEPNPQVLYSRYGHPMKITLESARRLIHGFLTRGESTNHSSMGGTAWVLQEYCALHDIPYSIEICYCCNDYVHPCGYSLRKVK